MSSYPSDETLPLGEPDPLLDSTYGASDPQDATSVSYPDAEWFSLYMPLQEPGEDPTNASQVWESIVHPINAPQFLSFDTSPPIDLVTDVQAQAGGDESGCSPSETTHCEACDRWFKRPQEWKRHYQEVHMPKRECPFNCNYPWTVARPAKIKDHLTEVHGREFSPEIVQEIRKLRGKGIVKFVDALEFDPYQSECCGFCHEKKFGISSEGVFEQTVKGASE